MFGHEHFFIIHATASCSRGSMPSRFYFHEIEEAGKVQRENAGQDGVLSKFSFTVVVNLQQWTSASPVSGREIQKKPTKLDCFKGKGTHKL
ncbi:uncharacterized protein [Narcine bancroftii]|uniref:uncharacterized protein isoform X3 n=1 Tax=Narcine bancroftii TaxID=1343680 RepID=UPI0038315FB5